ncbi:MAG: class II fructose-bisphosphate aldolase [Planctomycetes bacterium]|nr:class II fructose-bisphosphate aldolase [Planctomycetota bacterium]
MPVVTDPVEVKEIYQEVAEKGACIPCFCTENQKTIEAMLRAAHEVGQEFAIANPPLVVGFTATYHHRQQLMNYTTTRDTVLGVKALLDDVKLFAGEDSPWSDVRIMPHLDHGMPDTDRTLLYNFAEEFATSMHDCSHLTFEENVKQTAAYVEAVQGKTLVEGAVDEISEVGASGEEQLTTVEQAKRFLSETGCAFIVPNLGTEHRATGGEVKYYANRAREISAAVGKILVLHGTSSLGEGAMQNLGRDGIVKVNIWTRLATSGGKAIAKHVVKQLGNILSEEEIKALIEEGWLTDKYLDPSYIKGVCGGKLAPVLEVVAEVDRTNVWVEEVVQKMKEYFYAFGYENLAK